MVLAGVIQASSSSWYTTNRKGRGKRPDRSNDKNINTMVHQYHSADANYSTQRTHIWIRVKDPDGNKGLCQNRIHNKVMDSDF